MGDLINVAQTASQGTLGDLLNVAQPASLGSWEEDPPPPTLVYLLGTPPGIHPSLHALPDTVCRETSGPGHHQTSTLRTNVTGMYTAGLTDVTV